MTREAGADLSEAPWHSAQALPFTLALFCPHIHVGPDWETSQPCSVMVRPAKASKPVSKGHIIATLACLLLHWAGTDQPSPMAWPWATPPARQGESLLFGGHCLSLTGNVKCFFLLLEFQSIPEKTRLGSRAKSISLKMETSKPHTHPRELLLVLLTPDWGGYTLNVSGTRQNVTDMGQLLSPLTDMSMFISPLTSLFPILCLHL